MLAWLATSWACLDSLEPDVGPPLNTICVDEDSDPDVDVSFREDIVLGLFELDDVGCLLCHAPSAQTPIGFEVGGLDLSSQATLRSGGAISGSDIVIPGKPCKSILLQKVSPGPPFGARMPLNGPPVVSAQDRQLLHDWIAEGAQNN